MARRPNILLITSDQQHYDTLGVTNPRISTPALDRLCREGTRFDRAYCPSPVCSPTRASLITGQYPSTHGCWTIGVKLPEDVPTIGDQLRRGGYESILIGKAHFQPLASRPGSESIECQPILRDLDFWRDFKGPWYGFDRCELARMHADESHVGQHYALWLEEKGLKNWADYFQPWPPPPRTDNERYFLREQRSWNLPDSLHHSTWIAERTIAHIDRCADEGRPFFLWSSFFDPHPPYRVPEPWAGMYDPRAMVIDKPYRDGEFDRMPPHYARTREAKPDFRYLYDQVNRHGLHGVHSHLQAEDALRRDIACYYGMTSLMDREIGRILDALDRRGLAEETLVVFTSDHGHFIGQHGLIAKGPFHYEDVIRVPMIARWTGRIPAGRVSTSLQSLLDYPATFLSGAGLEVPGWMQGLDQLGCWEGAGGCPRDHVVCENRHNPTKMHLRTWVDDRYKITVYRGETYGELFDLQADPDERNNLWHDPAAQRLKGDLLFRFMQSVLESEPTRMQRIAGA